MPSELAAVHLPSGALARLSGPAIARARTALGDAGPFAGALAVLASEGVLADERGAPLDVYTLPVRDVHTLRALLTHAGHLPEEPAGFTCENCGAPFDAAPSTLLEIGPFLDGELSDPDLDAAFPFGEPRPIPRVPLPAAAPRSGVRRASGFGASRPAASSARAASFARPLSPSRPQPRSADTVTFAERTADDARALFRAADAWLGGGRATRITPAIVLGMGVVALGAERRTPVIAQALQGAPTAAWSKIIDLWLDAAYPRRLFGLHRCPACGARNDLDVPLAREWDREPPAEPAAHTDAGEGTGGGEARSAQPESKPPARTRARARGRDRRPPFPDLDAFEASVRAHADRIYAARGVRNIDLFVDAGVPACDDGGEPLLGSYVPGGTDEATWVPRAPEIRLYYRTFKSEYEADPELDVEGEIHETIDHEIEHHLHHLGGHDPLDEEEHAAIDRAELRRIGVREAARRGRRAVVGDVTGFFRTTWPLWIAVLIAAAIVWVSRQ